MSTDYKPVVFENSLGETISNDPVYKAHQQLVAAGVIPATPEDEDVDDNDETSEGPLIEESVDTLKRIAREEGVDMAGVKKKSELVARIEAHRAAAESDDQD